MKFEAKVPDVTLELTTLEGQEITLQPRKVLSGGFAKEIMKKWSEMENAQEKLGPIEIITTELSDVYPQTKEWFEENFDLQTLQEILTYVAETVGGAKKKRTSSKQS